MNNSFLMVGKKLKAIFMLLLPVGLTSNAYAAAGDLTPLTDLADLVLEFLTGDFATAVASIAVVGLGYLGLSGRIRMQLALTIIVAIVVIFGGAQIVEALKP